MSRPHILAEFGLRDMAACGTALRKFGQQEANMEAFAKRATSYFYENLVDAKGGSACALVRFFVTQKAANLPSELKALLPTGIPRSLRCLTLLGTAGSEPEWCARDLSTGHQVIPLMNEEMVKRSPMISQLIKQFGLEIGNVLNPTESVLLDAKQQSYNVFYVAEAKGSAVIPAQDSFVVPYRIESVLGFGGMLPSGDLFAMIMFGKVPVARHTANLFRTITLSLRLAILPFDQQAIFSNKEVAYA